MLNAWQIIPSHEDVFIQRYRLLLGFSLRLTGNDREQAEDLVHDAFVQFTLSRPDLDSIQNLEGYLYRMLRNMYLSLLRRAARAPQRPISVVDYDSAEVSLAATDYQMLSAREELRAICSYACARKETSKVGSVLILRFFHGYYPEEIAQVLRSPRRAVDDWLRLARREAKLYLEKPSRRHPLRSGIAAQLFSTGQTTSAFLGGLRQSVFRSCHGDCLNGQLRDLYRGEVESIDSSTLGHLVSCADCLDEVNALLGLPPLQERYPTDMLGPDTRSRGGTLSGGPDGSSKGSAGKSLHRRARLVYEHSPRELVISVNGFIVGSQTVGAEFNEQTLNINLAEKIGFAEVFSEQGVRLLFAEVEPPPDGLVEQPARVELSEGRILELNVSFSEAWPRIHALYRDPALKSIREVATDHSQEISFSDSDKSSEVKKSLVRRLCNGLFGWRLLLRPATITTLLAFLLIATLVLLRITSSPVLAADLLHRAAASEQSYLFRPDAAVHRVVYLDEYRPEGELVSRQKIEVWLNSASGQKARRVYDERGKLLAGEWTDADGSRTVCRRGARTEVLQGSEVVGDASRSILDAREIWRLEPSAAAYLSLTQGAANAVVMEKAGLYVISYEAPASVVRGSDALLRANITIRRTDLHPLAQSLLVEGPNGTREYRFSENHIEQVAPDAIRPDVFRPDTDVLGPAASLAPGNGPEPAEHFVEPARLGPARLAELEVEALYQMHRIGACLTEQSAIERTAEGELHVQAIVETEGRKTEFIQALSGLAMIPSVRIEVRTVAEAVKSQTKLPPVPTVFRRIEIAAERVPAYDDLHNYFSGKHTGESAPRVDLEIRRFISRMLNLSRSSLLHALALRRHAGEFASGELGRLNSEQQARYDLIVSEHAVALQRDTAQLRAGLEPIFFVGSANGQEASAGTDAAPDAEDATVRLVELAQANERAVRMAFALSGSGSNLVIGTEQFQRSLKRVEVLAERMAHKR